MKKKCKKSKLKKQKIRKEEITLNIERGNKHWYRKGNFNFLQKFCLKSIQNYFKTLKSKEQKIRKTQEMIA